MKYKSKCLPKDIDKYEVEISKEETKSDYIVRKLVRYGVEDPRDAIRFIEEQGIDKFDFDYPYGSFSEYKKHVLTGEFDVDVESCMMTSEQREELRQLVKEGKLWITY